MKHEIIEQPKLIGCLNCSPVPSKALPKTTSLDIGFGMVTLEIDDETVWYEMESNKNVNWLTKRYKKNLESAAKCSTLHFETPLHDELYEYNKNDGEWYLVKQGMGFA